MKCKFFNPIFYIKSQRGDHDDMTNCHTMQINYLTYVTLFFNFSPQTRENV